MLVWISVLVVATTVAGVHATRPGLEGRPAAKAPLAKEYRLLMFAHPQCPCTRASLDNLAQALAGAEGAVIAKVFFYRPVGSPTDWNRTDLWRLAASIPHVVPVDDPGGEYAKKAGAFTSGETMLYRPNGTLAFAGGITDTRGHEGESVGMNAIQTILRGGQGVGRTPVFGCGIQGDER